MLSHCLASGTSDRVMCGGRRRQALNQNMNVSAPTVSQRAAVAALSADAAIELRAHVAKYEANQRVVVDGLTRMGVQPHEYAPPRGAFCARRALAPSHPRTRPGHKPLLRMPFAASRSPREPTTRRQMLALSRWPRAASQRERGAE